MSGSSTNGREGVRFDGRVLLLADDTALVRSAIASELEDLGFRVVQAEDGREALELLQAHAEKLDGAIIDLLMPGMSGWQTARQIAEKFPDLPIVLMSGLSESEASKGCEFETIEKPFSALELVDRLRLSPARRE